MVADAGFRHFPSPSGRVTWFQFGRFEVRNRIHFVRKHNLSLSKCYLGLALRMAMSVGSGMVHFNLGLLKRALGNLFELVLGGGRSQPKDEQQASLRHKHSVNQPVYPSTETLPPKES